MLDSFLNIINELIYVPDEGMVHPGLPSGWVAFIFVSMVLVGLRYALFYSENTLQKLVNYERWPCWIKSVSDACCNVSKL